MFTDSPVDISSGVVAVNTAGSLETRLQQILVFIFCHGALQDLHVENQPCPSRSC